MSEIAIFVLAMSPAVLFIIFFAMLFIGLVWMRRPDLSLLDIIKMAIHTLLEWLFGKGDK